MNGLNYFKNYSEIIGRYKNVYQNYLTVMLLFIAGRNNIKIEGRDGFKGLLTRDEISAIAYIFNVSKGTLNPTKVVGNLKYFNDSFSKKSTLPGVLWLLVAMIKKQKGPFDLENALNTIKKETIDYNGRKLILHGMMENGDIPAVFFDEVYKDLNVENEIVVDIGANIGDSAIYFALNGARKVIALEPNPGSYLNGDLNIKINGFSEKIVLENAGYTKDGTILVDQSKGGNGSYKLNGSKTGKRVKLYSLKTLVNEFGIDSALLKMDCEGCEYSLLNEDDNVLRKFRRINLEYHYGYRELKEKLESVGFEVSLTKGPFLRNCFIDYYNRLSKSRSFMNEGYLVAVQTGRT